MTEAQEYPPIVKWTPGITSITRGEDAKGRPQLLLPDNKYVSVHFPWGDFQEINNQWGVSYKFNVNIEDQRYSMFANKKLYQAIVDYGLKENQTIQIKRTMTDFEKDGEKRKYMTFDLIPPDDEETIDDKIENIYGPEPATQGSDDMEGDL